MMHTLCNNREATIDFGDKISRRFNLITGFAQGNSPSPTLYNLGEQILLFKIELDPSVASVYNHSTVPREILRPENRLAHEAHETFPDKELCRETDKTDAFADDTNIGTLLNYASLSCLKRLL